MRTKSNSSSAAAVDFGREKVAGMGPDGTRPVRAFEWDKQLLRLLDQRKLPATVTYVECCTVEEVAEAIRAMAVRGAPAIGVAAAFGLVLAARRLAEGGGARDAADFRRRLQEAADLLASTRPTAVNLFWAIRRMLGKADEGLSRLEAGGGRVGLEQVVAVLEREAEAIAREDAERNRSLGRWGAGLIKDGDGILTYCNTGSLATAGYGTALGVIRAAHEQGKSIRVYACETRPFLQGARLTAWELLQEGIPTTLITDNMAAHLMQQGKVQLVIVGADRIAANGDFANKIGTYGLAVLAHAHGIPFYTAAPLSTIDLDVPNGKAIPIEERDPREVTHVAGVAIAPPGVAVYNPAFDVTPARLVTGIITERGIARPPYLESLKRLFQEETGRDERGN